MKELSLEKMEQIEGGGCPWWGGLVVAGFFGVAAAISGPGAIILGPAGFLAEGVYSYACSQMQ